MPTRCRWAEAHPLLSAYHDQEWGVPTRDRNRLFEFVVLEGAQAGLSWLTILKRREAYRQAFAGFNPDIVAGWGESEAVRLLNNPGIIRNRAKIWGAVQNARVFLDVEEKFSGFDGYLDHYTGGQIICRHVEHESDLPTQDDLSRAVSHDLAGRGFRFFGPTICYSYLQAVGVVMDHVKDCLRYAELVPKAWTS